MSPTHDYVIANGTGSSVRSDINDALAAVVSQNSSSTAPATTYAYMIWVDTTTNIVKMRNGANSAWIELFETDGEFGSKTFNGNITLNAQGDLRFADSDSSNWVAFQAPATVASNVTWTLPSADGTANQTLITNGSGTLSWATPTSTSDKITEGNTEAEVVDTGSDGHFKVTTEGTERFRINSSGNVGIGTTSAGGKLHVSSGSSSALVSADADELIVENSGNSGITIASPNSGTCSIRFADPQNNDSGSISYNHNDETLRFATFSTERMRIDSGGKVFINTTSTSGFVDDGSKLYIRNNGQCVAIYNDTGSGWNVRHNATSNGGTFYYISFAAAGTGVGSITSSSTTTTYATTSDYRLKENIEPIAGAVDRLKELNPCRFNFIAAPERTVDGFIAHEVQEHVPEAIVGAKDAVDEKGEPVYQGIDQSKLVPLLTAALQEAIGRIEALEAEVAALKTQ